MPTPYQLPDGRWVNLPDDPAARAALERAIASRYPGAQPSTIDPNAPFLSTLDPLPSQRPPTSQKANGEGEGTILGSAWEGIKQIPFGLLDVPISIAESVIGIATPHKDYDIEKWLRRAGEYGSSRIDPMYADSFLPKVGMGIGQVAGMMAAGLSGAGIGGALAGTARAARIGSGVLGNTAMFSLGISDQTRRIAEMEQRTGRRISAPRQTMAHALGALTGFTEKIALKGYVPKGWQQKMGWTKAANKLVSGGLKAADEKKLMSVLIPRLAKAGVSGLGAEAIQEAGQQFLQAGISRALYDPNAMEDILASMAEDAKVGGAVGGIAGVFMDLMANGLGRRRGPIGPRGQRDVVEGALARGNGNAERQFITDSKGIIRKDNTGILKRLIASGAELSPTLSEYGGIDLDDASVESIDQAIQQQEIRRVQALAEVDSPEGYKPGPDGMTREELKRNINEIADRNIGRLGQLRTGQVTAQEDQYNENISLDGKNVDPSILSNTFELLGNAANSFLAPILSGDAQGYAFIPGKGDISEEGAQDINSVDKAWGEGGIKDANEFVNETGANADLGLESVASELGDRPLDVIRKNLLDAERELSERTFAEDMVEEQNELQERVRLLREELAEAELARTNLEYKPGATTDNARVATPEVASVMLENSVLADPDVEIEVPKVKVAGIALDDEFWTMPPPKAATDTRVFAQYSMFSGGAKGADTEWGKVAEEFGVGSAGVEEGYGIRHIRANEMTPAHIEEAHPHVMKAGGSLSRTYPMKPHSKRSPEKTEYANNLLRRNYFQVKNADAVFAVGNLVTDRIGARKELGAYPLTEVRGLEAKGGTGWAVQMAIDQGKPVYLFDQSSGKWYTGDNHSRRVVRTPRLTPRFAGVGTRDLSKRGKEAIKDVFVRSTYPEVEASTPQVGAWPEPGAGIPGLPAATLPPLEFKSHIKKDEQTDEKGDPLWAGDPSIFSNFSPLGQFGIAPAEEARPTEGDFDYGMPYEDSLLGPVRAKTVEHAYQAQKFNDPKIREQIYALETPGQAKQIVKNLPRRKDFNDAEAKAIMMNIVRQKFAAGTSLRELLKSVPLNRKIEEKAYGKDSRWRRIMQEIYDDLRLEILEEEGALKMAREKTVDVVSDIVKDMEPPEEGLEFLPSQRIASSELEGRVKRNISELNDTEFTDYVANQMEPVPGLVLLVNATQKEERKKDKKGDPIFFDEKGKFVDTPDYKLSSADRQGIRDFIEINGKPQAGIVPMTGRSRVAGRANTQVLHIFNKLGINRIGTDRKLDSREFVTVDMREKVVDEKTGEEIVNRDYGQPIVRGSPIAEADTRRIPNPALGSSLGPNSPIVNTDTTPYWEQLSLITQAYKAALNNLDKEFPPTDKRKKKSSWEILEKSKDRTTRRNISPVAGETAEIQEVWSEGVPIPLDYQDRIRLEQKGQPAAHLNRSTKVWSRKLNKFIEITDKGNALLLQRLRKAAEFAESGKSEKHQAVYNAVQEVRKQVRNWEAMVKEKSMAWKDRNRDILSELTPSHLLLLGRVDGQSRDFAKRNTDPELKNEEDRLRRELRLAHQDGNETEINRLDSELLSVEEALKPPPGGFLTPHVLALQKNTRGTVPIKYSAGRTEGGREARTAVPRIYRHYSKLNPADQAREITAITKELDQLHEHDIGPRVVTDLEGEQRAETREEYAARIEQEVGPFIERNNRIGTLKFDRNRALAELFATVLYGAKRLLSQRTSRVGLTKLARRLGYTSNEALEGWLDNTIQKAEKALDVYNHFDYMTQQEIERRIAGQPVTPEQRAEIVQDVTVSRKQDHMPRAAVLDATDTINISKLLYDKDVDARKSSDAIFDMQSIANFTNWVGRKGIDSREGFAERATAEVLDGFMARQKKKKTVTNEDIKELLKIKNILLRSKDSRLGNLAGDIGFGFESTPFVKLLKDMTGADNWKGATNAQKRLMYSKLLSLPSQRGVAGMYLPNLYDGEISNGYKDLIINHLLGNEVGDQLTLWTSGNTVNDIYQAVRNHMQDRFREGDFNEALAQVIESKLVQESDLQVFEEASKIPLVEIPKLLGESHAEHRRRTERIEKDVRKSRDNYIKILEENVKESALREERGEPPMGDRTKAPLRKPLRFGPDTKGSEWIHEALPTDLPTDPAALEGLVKVSFAELNVDGTPNPFYTLLRNEPRELMSDRAPELGRVLEKVRLEMNPDLVQSSRGMVPPPVMVLAGGPIMYEKNVEKLVGGPKGRRRQIQEIGQLEYRRSDLRYNHLIEFLKDAIELDGMPRLVRLPESRNADMWTEALVDVGVPEEAIVEIKTQDILLSYAQKEILKGPPRRRKVRKKARRLGGSPILGTEEFEAMGEEEYFALEEEEDFNKRVEAYEKVKKEEIGRRIGDQDLTPEQRVEIAQGVTVESIIQHIKRGYETYGVPMPKLPDGETHGDTSAKYWKKLSDNLTYMIRDRRLLGLPVYGAGAMEDLTRPSALYGGTPSRMSVSSTERGTYESDAAYQKRIKNRATVFLNEERILRPEDIPPPPRRFSRDDFERTPEGDRKYLNAESAYKADTKLWREMNGLTELWGKSFDSGLDVESAKEAIATRLGKSVQDDERKWATYLVSQGIRPEDAAAAEAGGDPALKGHVESLRRDFDKMLRAEREADDRSGSTLDRQFNDQLFADEHLEAQDLLEGTPAHLLEHGREPHETGLAPHGEGSWEVESLDAKFNEPDNRIIVGVGTRTIGPDQMQESTPEGDLIPMGAIDTTFDTDSPVAWAKDIREYQVDLLELAERYLRVNHGVDAELGLDGVFGTVQTPESLESVSNRKYRRTLRDDRAALDRARQPSTLTQTFMDDPVYDYYETGRGMGLQRKVRLDKTQKEAGLEQLDVFGIPSPIDIKPTGRPVTERRATGQKRVEPPKRSTATLTLNRDMSSKSLREISDRFSDTEGKVLVDRLTAEQDTERGLTAYHATELPFEGDLQIGTGRFGPGVYATTSAEDSGVWIPSYEKRKSRAYDEANLPSSALAPRVYPIKVPPIHELIEYNGEEWQEIAGQLPSREKWEVNERIAEEARKRGWKGIFNPPPAERSWHYPDLRIDWKSDERLPEEERFLDPFDRLDTGTEIMVFDPKDIQYLDRKNNFTKLQNLVNKITGIPLTQQEFASNYHTLLAELSLSDIAAMEPDAIDRLASLLSAKAPAPPGSMREGVFNVSAEGLGQDKGTIVPNDPNDTTRFIRKEVNEINNRHKELDAEVKDALREIGADESVVVEYVADLHSLWQLNKDVAVTGESISNDVQAVYDRIGNRIIINLSLIDPYDHMSASQVLRQAAFHEGIHHLYLTNRLSNREVEILFKYVENTVVDENIDPEAHRLGQTYYQWKALDPRYANLNMRDLKMEASIDVLTGLASDEISAKKSAGAIGVIKKDLVSFISAFVDPAKKSGITPIVAILNKVMSGEVGSREATTLSEGITKDVENSVLAKYAVPEELDALTLAVTLSKEAKNPKDRLRYEAEAEAIIKKITEVREDIKKSAPEPPDEIKQTINNLKLEDINDETSFGGVPLLNSIDQLQHLVDKYGPEFIEAHAWALDEYIKMREDPEYSGYTMPSKFSTMLRRTGSNLTDRQRALNKKNIEAGFISPMKESIDKLSINENEPQADGESIDETTSTFLDLSGRLRQNFFDTREKPVRQARRLMERDEVAYQQADSSALVAIRWHDQTLSFMPGLLGYGPVSYSGTGPLKGDFAFKGEYVDGGWVGKETDDALKSKLNPEGEIPGLEDIFHGNKRLGHEGLSSEDDVMAAAAYGYAERIDTADKALQAALAAEQAETDPDKKAALKVISDQKLDDLNDLIRMPGKKGTQRKERFKTKTGNWKTWVAEQLSTYGQNQNILEFWKYFHAFNRKMIKAARDTKLITQEQHDEYIKRKWVPFYSDLVGDVETSPFGGLGAHLAGPYTAMNKIERAIKGGPPTLTGNIKLSFERSYKALIRDMTQQVAVARIVRDTVSLGEASYIDPSQMPEGTPLGNDFSLVRFQVDGVPTFAKFDDVEYAKSIMIGGINPRKAIAQFFGGGRFGDTVAKAFLGMAQVLRETVTRMPPYMFKNLTRDAMDADVTLGNGPTLWFAAMRNAFNPNSLQRAARLNIAVGLDVMTHGGVGERLYEARFRRQLKDVNWLNPLAVAAAVWQGLGRMASQSEVAVRLAIYDRVMAMEIPNMTAAQQKSMAKSLALELLNYGRRGANPMWRTFMATVPFLNGRMQGVDKLWRVAFSKTLDAPDFAVLGMSPAEQRAYMADPKNKGKQIWKRRRLAVYRRGLMLATLSGIYYALMHDDEEYKNIREDVKADNWLIPMSKSRWLKIPIPFEIGVLFKVIPEQMMKLIMEKETNVSDVTLQMRRQIRNSLSFGPPQLIAPFVDAIRNKDAYRGDFIVDPLTEQLIDPSEQYTRYTSNVARGVAKLTNTIPLVKELDFLTSPQKLEYMMRQFLGTAGSYGIIVADRAARHGIIPFVEAENVVGTTYDFDWGSLIGGRGMENVPLLGDLFIDPRRGNENVQTLYEMVREMDRFMATKGRVTDRDWRKGMEYMHENLQYEAWQGELRSLERAMANVTEHKEFTMDRIDISEEEKRARVSRVTEMTNRILGRIQDLRVTLRTKPQRAR